MIWILASTAAAFFWALTNISDQVIMRKYFKGSALEIMTANNFVSLIPFVFLLIFNTGILSIDPKTGKHMGLHIIFLISIMIGLYLLFYNV